MADVLDPFAGAKAENEDQRKQLLDIIASGGSAAEKAYKDAQAQVASTRQSAIDRSLQRAKMTGQSLGGEDTGRVTETADRFGNYLGAQNAAAQTGLQDIGASGASYLAKINAIAPFIQSQNMNKASDRQNQIQAAIELAKQKAAADAQAKIDEQNFELKKLGIQNQNAKDLAGLKAQKANQPTMDSLLGQANQLLPGAQKAVAGLPTFDTTSITHGGGSLGKAIAGGTPGANLNAQAAAILAKGGQGVPSQTYMIAQMTPTDLAAQLGRAQGASDNVINALYSPAKMASVAAAIQKSQPIPAPDVKTAAKFVGGDTKVAQTVVDSQRYKDATAAAGQFLNEPLDPKTGRIVDTDPDYGGLTPYDAYIKYVTSTLVDPTKYDRTMMILGGVMRPMFSNLSKS